MSWYNPKDASSAIPEGWYNAIIEDISAGTTKKGQPMQIVAFRVYGPREMVLKEYFHAASLWKYKNLAKAFGKLAEFNAGQFDAANFRNKSLDVELAVEDSPEYGEQNRVKGFAPDGDQAGMPPAPRPAAKAAVDDDHDLSDVPF